MKLLARKYGFNAQNLLPRYALQKCCFWKFHKAHKKMPWKYLQPATTLVKNLHGSYFRVNFVRFFTTILSQNNSARPRKMFSSRRKYLPVHLISDPISELSFKSVSSPYFWSSLKHLPKLWRFFWCYWKVHVLS